MRTRSEMVMIACLKSEMGRLWGGLAAVEPFGEGYGLLVVITNRLVESMDLRIVFANHKLKFQYPAGPKPLFGGIHDGPAKALVARLRIDRDVIDPTAMAIVAGHDRRD